MNEVNEAEEFAPEAAERPQEEEAADRSLSPISRAMQDMKQKRKRRQEREQAEREDIPTDMTDEMMKKKRKLELEEGGKKNPVLIGSDDEPDNEGRQDSPGRRPAVVKKEPGAPPG